MNIKNYDDVLSIDQMIELEELGFDTSDASCTWNSIQDKDYKPYDWLPCFRGEDKQTIENLRKAFPLTYQEGNLYYCYTLNDLLKKLPKKLFDNEELDTLGFATAFKLVIYPDNEYPTIEYKRYNDFKVLHQEGYYGMRLVDAAFNMLKWLKTNNFLDKNEK